MSATRALMLRNSRTIVPMTTIQHPCLLHGRGFAYATTRCSGTPSSVVIYTRP